MRACDWKHVNLGMHDWRPNPHESPRATHRFGLINIRLTSLIKLVTGERRYNSAAIADGWHAIRDKIQTERCGTNLILTLAARRSPGVSAIDARHRPTTLIGTPEQLLTQLVQHTIPF